MKLLLTYKHVKKLKEELHPIWVPTRYPIPKYVKEPTYYNYMVTIVPKGKNKTHADQLPDIFYHFMGRKSIIQFWLFREETQTNHFHGIVRCRREAKLKFNISSCVVHNNGLIQCDDKALLYILKDQKHGDEYTYFNRWSSHRYPQTLKY